MESKNKEGQKLNEEKLVRRLKKKDEKALEETVRHYTPLVATIIYNVSNGTMSKEDIEEVTSDVFITLWNNTEKIIPDKLKGYICCIAKTRALNKLKATSRKDVISLDDYEFSEDIEDDFSITDETEQKDIGRELRNIIEKIDEPDKTILIRYYYYYQSTTKIAQIMNIKVETVKTKLKRTREKIRTMLSEGGYAL